MKFNILCIYVALALVVAVDYGLSFPTVDVQVKNKTELNPGDQDGDVSFFPGCAINLPWLEQSHNLEDKDILQISEKLKLVLNVIKDAKLKLLVKDLSNIDDDADCVEACEEYKINKLSPAELEAPPRVQGMPASLSLPGALKPLNKTEETIPIVETEPTTTATEAPAPIIEEPTTKAPTLIIEEPTTKAPELIIEEPTTKAPELIIEEPTTKAPELIIEEPTTKAPELIIEEPTTKAPELIIEEPTTKAPELIIEEPTTKAPALIIEEPTTKAPAPIIVEPTIPKVIKPPSTNIPEELVIKPVEPEAAIEKLETITVPKLGQTAHKQGYIHKNKKHKPHRKGTPGEETEITTTVTKKNHTLGEISSEEESESLEEEYSLDELQEVAQNECPKEIDIIKTVQEKTGSSIVSVTPDCDIDLNAVQKALTDNKLNPEKLDELHDKFSEMLYNMKEPTLKNILQDIVDELEEYKEPCPKVCDIVKNKKKCSHLSSTTNVGEQDFNDINEVKSKKIDPQVNIKPVEQPANDDVDDDDEDFHLDARFADDDDETDDIKENTKVSDESQKQEGSTVKVKDTLKDVFGESAIKSQSTDAVNVNP